MATQRISAPHRPPAPSLRTSVSSGSRYSKPSPHHSIRSGAPRAAPAPPAGPLRISTSLRAPRPSNRNNNNHPYAPEVRNSSTFFNNSRPSSKGSSKGSRLGGYHGGYHRLPPAGPAPQRLPGGAGGAPFLHPPSGANLFPPPPHPNPNHHHHRDSSPHVPSRSGTSSDSDHHTAAIPKRKRGKRQGWKIDVETLPPAAKAGLWLMCSTPKKVARAERQQREWRARAREGRWMRRHMVMVEEGEGEEEEKEEEGDGDDEREDDKREDEGDGEGKGKGKGEGEGEGVGAQQQGAKGGMSPPGMPEKEREDWDREFARLGVKE
ncbi:hypothetical protein F5144DRAFT_633736 [Chaetomium tenue]|uniref:Uncharacterized protein n=1 Tax=Chaetomium tenue TaxID=1854479 RepID=A0ACB7NVS5_9PEZI|nr:hypothetical protein F5144DRAFT_633736 [Chaetomium globosum]